MTAPKNTLTDDDLIALTESQKLIVTRNVGQSTAAAVSGVSPRTLRDHPELRHANKLYDLAKVVAFAVDIRTPTEEPKGNSNATEIINEERAKLLILDRMEREGTLVSRDETRKVWALLAEMIRNATVVLRRQYGEDAAQVLTDMMDEYAAAVSGWNVDEAYLEATTKDEMKPKAKRRVKRKKKRTAKK